RERFGEPDDVREEAEIFEAAGVEMIPPPVREGSWEIDAAASGTLPTLVTLEDLRGTLHNHSTWSDGVESVEAMAEAARARGWNYYGIGDHSRSLQIAHGLSIEDLRAQMAEAAEINARFEASGVDMRVLTGSECDILQDGSMDFPDEVLAELDVVVASVHLKLTMDEAEATERVVRAVSSPHVDILGHATGRLLLRRDGYPLDMDAVLDACAEHHTAVELNANPWRLDMDWQFLRAARDRGIPISINPDAHTIEGLDDTQWGVASAQKAGLEAADILNARTRDALLDWIAGGRA
ncbi:MAG: PHP domain-containing protein, partial [Bacteroidota bacterium]